MNAKGRIVRFDDLELPSSIMEISLVNVYRPNAYVEEVNETITEIAQKAGLANEDGKIELAFNPERRLMVVDVVGTLDECRFTYQGIHVSKEIARMYYRQTEWYNEVEKVKHMAAETGVKEWKSLCSIEPPKLDPHLKTIIGEMYMAAANALTSRKLFYVPSLAETVKKYKDYINEVRAQRQ